MCIRDRYDTYHDHVYISMMSQFTPIALKDYPEINRTVTRLSLIHIFSYIDSHSHGDMVSRIIADVDTFSEGLLMGFTQLFTGIATIAGTLIFMLTIDVKISCIVVLITPLSPVSYTHLTGHGLMKKLMRKSLTRMRDSNKSFALLYPYSCLLYTSRCV